MFSVIATHNKTSYGVNFYLADTYDELNEIKARAGSKAYVIEKEATYILNNRGEWKEYFSALKKYVDDKLAAVDPEVVEELKNLLEQIESGNIDQMIADQVSEQLQSETTQTQLVELVKEDEEIITVTKLENYNYITEQDLEEIIFSGGTASTI